MSTINVFVYGTLMNPAVRRMILGHSGTTYSNVLEGYRKEGLNIVEDSSYEVDGVTFEVTKDELASLDHYEGVAHGVYKRIAITLKDGEKAIAYQKVNPDMKINYESSSSSEE